MRKSTWKSIAFLNVPELSESELAHERHKQEIASALGRVRSRLDTIHGLVRQEKEQDAELLARAALVDLANLLPLLGEGKPVETPTAAAQALSGLFQSQLSDLTQEENTTIAPKLELIDALFWMLRKRARRIVTTELITRRNQYEVKRRWQVGITLGLILATMSAIFTIHQHRKSRQYISDLDSMSVTVDIDHKQGYIREWLFSDVIDGPHGFGRNIDVDFMETAGGEPRILPIPGMASRLIDDTTTIWRSIVSPTDTIDVSGLLEHRDNAVVYAFTTIHSSSSRLITLFLGSDDGIKVWLNGKVVFQENRLRVLKQDENRVQVNLREGVNALLLKITQDKGPWGFSCRIETETETDGPDA